MAFVLVCHFMSVEVLTFFNLQVLERDQITNQFQEVTNQLEQALGEISYENLDISDEVKEQVGISSRFGLFVFGDFYLFGNKHNELKSMLVILY